MGGSYYHAFVSMNVYLGLGSNIGDSQSHLETAIQKLTTWGDIRAVSSFYETEPVGVTDQAWFLNCVLLFETELSPEELLVKAKEIEKELGRTASIRNGPRIIDIDILLYDDRIIEADDLTVPHPRIHERRFVLLPLSEISPNLVHPIFKRTIAELLQELPEGSWCEKLLH